MKLKRLMFAAALTVLSAIPAAAQDLGVGVGFLGDDGGIGVNVDYSSPFTTQNSSNFVLGWAADVGFYPNGGNELVSFKSLFATGGVRAVGQLGMNDNWLAQFLIGLNHSSGSFKGIDDLCDFLGTDCSSSDNSLMGLIGFGYQHAMGKNAFKAQLDFPVLFTDGGGHSTRFSIWYVLHRRK